MIFSLIFGAIILLYGIYVIVGRKYRLFNIKGSYVKGNLARVLGAFWIVIGCLNMMAGVMQVANLRTLIGMNAAVFMIIHFLSYNHAIDPSQKNETD